MPKPKTLTREEWIKAGIIAAKELQRREDAKSAAPKDKKKKEAKPSGKATEKPKKELKKASGLKGAKKNAEEKMSS